MTRLRDALVLGLLMAGIAVLVAVGLLAVRVYQMVNALEPKIVGTIEDTNRTLRITAGAVTNIEKASRDLSAQEQAEVKSINAISAKLQTIATDADTTVTKLNTTLDSVNTLVQNSDRNVGKVTDEASATVHALQPALASLNAELNKLPATTDKLNTALDGLKPIEDAAAETTENTAQVTANLVVVTENSRKVSDYWAKKFMTPEKAMVTIAKATLHYAVLFGGAFLGAR